MKLHRIIIFLAVFSTTASVSLRVVADDRPLCPSKISVAQNLLGKAPDGWSNYDAKGDYPYVGVSFWFGPPDKKALLAPSKEGQNSAGPVATWTFTKSDIDYWVACEYSRTNVVVARSIGKKVDSCTVQYDKRFSGPVAKSWSCKTEP
jgi:hypothetical protein